MSKGEATEQSYSEAAFSRRGKQKPARTLPREHICIRMIIPRPLYRSECKGRDTDSHNFENPGGNSEKESSFAEIKRV